jgi:hypothetical protein
MKQAISGMCLAGAGSIALLYAAYVWLGWTAIVIYMALACVAFWGVSRISRYNYEKWGR